MKRLFFIVMVIIMATSCSVLHRAVVDNPVESHSLSSDSKASLNVSTTKVSYVYRPSKDDAKTLSLDELKNNAVYEALESNGGYDVLVGANYYVTAKYGFFFFSRRVTSIKVSGYPAVYKDFRDAPENVISVDGVDLKLDLKSRTVK